MKSQLDSSEIIQLYNSIYEKYRCNYNVNIKEFANNNNLMYNFIKLYVKKTNNKKLINILVF